MSASADQHELRVHNQTEIDIQSLVLLRNMSSRIYFMLVAIFTVAAVFQFSGQVSGAQHCGMNTNILGQLVSQCEKYVLKSGPKIRPSPGCCAVVKKVDVPCVRKFVTKQIEEIVSIEKMVYVARSCGIKISAGTKCGSK